MVASLGLALSCLAILASSSPVRPPQQQPLLLNEPRVQDHSQDYVFDPLLHLPGISPYFDAVGFGLKHKAPYGCRVTAASYLIRHASIYANDKEYEEYIKPFLWKLEQHRDGWSGDLSFMSKWTSPILEDRLEDITPAGKKDAYHVGQHLVQLYPDLSKTVKRILSDTKARTHDTAVALSQAFPQPDDIEIVQISKSDKNGSMEALIPHKSCDNFSKEPGTTEMAEFVHNYAKHVADRLRPFMPFRLEDNDVVGLQGLCGYESAIRGKRSKICKVFTDSEWMAYEYAWDLRYSHMVGPLNPLSPYLGFPWLQGQSELFGQIDEQEKRADAKGEKSESVHTGKGWPEDQRFFLSFTHREVPPFIATALGIFNSSSNAVEEFPTDHINWTRSWKMSDLIPFLGHVGMEKLDCGQDSGMEGAFVRVVANTAPRPIPHCQGGPGASCPFEEFQSIIKAGAKKYGDFESVCSKDKKGKKKGGSD